MISRVGAWERGTGPWEEVRWEDSSILDMSGVRSFRVSRKPYPRCGMLLTVLG